MQKQRKAKEMKQMANPLPQTYITKVASVFVHPSEQLYILVDTEGIMKVFDIPTMALVAKAHFKLQGGYTVSQCMFSKADVGLFYTLCLQEAPQDPPQPQAPARHRPVKGNYLLSMNRIGKKGDILSSTCQLNLNGTEETKMEIQYRIGQQESNQEGQCSQNYQNMEREREKFVQGYFNQEIIPPPQNDSSESKPAQMDLAKKQRLAYAHNKGGGFAWESQLPRKARSTISYCNEIQHILGISLFIRDATAEGQGSGMDSGEGEFTVLSSHGLTVCSPSKKQQCIEVVDFQAVTGSNICSIIDGSKTLGAFQLSNQEHRDLWIIFSTTICLLIQLPCGRHQRSQCGNQPLLVLSKLPFQINAPYYSVERNAKRPSKGRLLLDRHKQICLAVSKQNEVAVISFGRLFLSVIGKIRLDSIPGAISNPPCPHAQDNISFMCPFRFGVNTSTNNKFENKVMVLIGVKNLSPALDKPKDQRQREVVSTIMEDESKMKQKGKQQEKEKRAKEKATCTVYAYSFQVGSGSAYHASTLRAQETSEQVAVLKQFLDVQQVWYCEYIENRLSFVSENEVQMVDLCRLLEGKHIGKEWVNLGYRFEALEANELYEELEDQFELTAEQNGLGEEAVRNKISQLSDWSYCLLPRGAILGGQMWKLQCFDF